jgi:hypothetical protein
MTYKPYIVECRKCGVRKVGNETSYYICASCLEIGYNSTYYRNRKIVFERDGYKCQCCGTKKNLLAHHIDCFRSNNSVTNLITLCTQCHLHLHSTYSHVELRRSNIYKLFPKIIKFGVFGKRFNPSPFIEKIKLKNTKRFFRNKKSL